eukprot:CAMPEP_0179969504 /NCGR_PEP_ID=MMETSP0983-20121128/34627_1 /TAXON_ID=483367 /ORGANISM="non described non described, Strain CCMP 2436" /LENGTH=115 /DNA_ID=CAMNT_0021883761 /DNA_START=289 /DNA_END=633 /DNA_ORIENTATION=-
MPRSFGSDRLYASGPRSSSTRESRRVASSAPSETAEIARVRARVLSRASTPRARRPPSWASAVRVRRMRPRASCPRARCRVTSTGGGEGSCALGSDSARLAEPSRPPLAAGADSR